MNTKFLPKTLTVSDAISVLELNDLPHFKAVDWLLRLSEEGLNIFFDSVITGYEVNRPQAQQIDPFDGSPSVIEIDEDATVINPSDGEIKFVSGFCEDNQLRRCHISVYRFQQNDIEYYSVEDSGHLIFDTDYLETRFYIYRENLLAFKEYKHRIPITSEIEKLLNLIPKEVGSEWAFLARTTNMYQTWPC